MHPDRKRDLLTLLRDEHLARLLEELHASLVRNGGPRGRVTIQSRDEGDALQAIIGGKAVAPGKTVAVRDIDQRLRDQSAFHCSLAEAIELLRGAPIVRPREIKARAAAARAAAVQRCFQMVAGLGLSPGTFAQLTTWMHAAEASLRQKTGTWGEESLLAALRIVALTFDRMPVRNGPPIFLAELAAEVAGDAHALDANRHAGKLLLRALAFYYRDTASREKPGSAAWRANLLSEAGIARDPISVRVDTFGLMGDTAYLEELRRAGLTRSVNLDDLERISGEVRAWRNVAFIVENPTVFAALIKHIRTFYVVDHHPTLICTNGNMNLADRMLLEGLARSGAHLFYGGDFDQKGLEIAARVLARYPGAASPWRMTPADYRDALRGEGSLLAPGAVDRVAHTFPSLAAEIAARGQGAHQENLIPVLKADLSRFVLEGATPPRLGDPPGGSAATQSISV